ncbi:MAG: lysophospholipase [Deltaproteobacteria bacterium]|nr:lysophospholipase [Deltaproteobacteria bacterium]
MRSIFSTASRIAPGLTSLVAAQLFRRTSRKLARAGERDVLRGATETTVAGMKTWSWGEGPTILLVHGWNGRATQLGGFVSPLVSRGYRVVAFDAVGHGDSPGDFLSLPELASCIREVAADLGDVYGVLAHSLGGAATTLALSQGLQVERAVFISPPSDPREFLRIFSGAIGISDEVRARVQARVERRLGVTMKSMQATVHAPSIRVPLLVIHDQDDKEVPVQVGRSVAEAWPGAELIVSRGLGHQRILRDEAVRNVAVSFIDAAERRKRAA